MPAPRTARSVYQPSPHSILMPPSGAPGMPIPASGGVVHWTGPTMIAGGAPPAGGPTAVLPGMPSPMAGPTERLLRPPTPAAAPSRPVPRLTRPAAFPGMPPVAGRPGAVPTAAQLAAPGARFGVAAFAGRTLSVNDPMAATGTVAAT